MFNAKVIKKFKYTENNLNKVIKKLNLFVIENLDNYGFIECEISSVDIRIIATPKLKNIKSKKILQDILYLNFKNLNTTNIYLLKGRRFK